MTTSDDGGYLDILRMMQRLGRDLIQMRDTDLSEIGVTITQSSAILFVGSNPGCRITDLGKNLEISHQAARTLVERMCAKGLLRTEVCEDDARARSIELTEEGSSMETKIRSRGCRTGKDALAGFDENELSEFESLLQRIRDNISDQ